MIQAANPERMLGRQAMREAAPLKRLADLAGAGILLLLTLPLFVAIAAAIRLGSPGPIFFVQERVGRNGRRFGAWKFRTMAVDAEARLAALLADDPAAAAEYRCFRKLRRDPRVTPVGRILRRYSLDELPQLCNVLRGEMSLVGPRCYLPEVLPAMGTAAPVVLSVRPGLTGLWQVSGRNGTTFAERVVLDLAYVRRRSPALDLRILGRTVLAVVSGRNAF